MAQAIGMIMATAAAKGKQVVCRLIPQRMIFQKKRSCWRIFLRREGLLPKSYKGRFASLGQRRPRQPCAEADEVDSDGRHRVLPVRLGMTPIPCVAQTKGSHCW